MCKRTDSWERNSLERMNGGRERKKICNEICCVVSHIITGSMKGWGGVGARMGRENNMHCDDRA